MFWAILMNINRLVSLYRGLERCGWIYKKNQLKIKTQNVRNKILWPISFGLKLMGISSLGPWFFSKQSPEYKQQSLWRPLSQFRGLLIIVSQDDDGYVSFAIASVICDQTEIETKPLPGNHHLPSRFDRAEVGGADKEKNAKNELMMTKDVVVVVLLPQKAMTTISRQRFPDELDSMTMPTFSW